MIYLLTGLLVAITVIIIVCFKILIGEDLE